MKVILIILFTIFSVDCLAQANREKDSIFLVQQSYLPKNDSLKVVIDITIDSSGKTITATYQPQNSTTTDKEIIEVAKKRALALRWSRSTDTIQNARIVFKFRLAN